MMDNYSLEWNKESLRALRLRLGWSRSDMARRLQCTLTEVESWEEGEVHFEAHLKGELEIIYRHAQECSDEVHYTPACENECDKNALDQIDFSRVKADLE